MDAPMLQCGSPWLMVWIRPRATLRKILDTNPSQMVFLLGGLAGVTYMLQTAFDMNWGDRLSPFQILARAALVGPVIGIVVLHAVSASLTVAGSLIGGKGSFKQVRAAAAWACVPSVWLLALWLPAMVLFGQELFSEEMLMEDESLPSTIGFMLFGLLNAVADIWTIVLALTCLGEAQGFSVWWVLLSFFLSGLILAGWSMLLVFVLMLALPG